MLSVPGGLKVFIALVPCDLRAGINTLLPWRLRLFEASSLLLMHSMMGTRCKWVQLRATVLNTTRVPTLLLRGPTHAPVFNLMRYHFTNCTATIFCPSRAYSTPLL
ncbi:MAG: hypothetical protein JWO94_3842 [Verrucomicrobiaceae bacterium]|nr:hypothetical protein [Verrucomicrobiaceae bacterium]